jgi:hypothetical protein
VDLLSLGFRGYSSASAFENKSHPMLKVTECFGKHYVFPSSARVWLFPGLLESLGPFGRLGEESGPLISFRHPLS